MSKFKELTDPTPEVSTGGDEVLKAYVYEFRQVQFFVVFVFERRGYPPRFFGYGSSFGHYGQDVWHGCDG